MYQTPAETMKEIEQLALLAEETLAQIQNKVEELRVLYRKHQEVFPNPAFLIDPSSRRRPQK